MLYALFVFTFTEGYSLNTNLTFNLIQVRNQMF